MKCDDPRECELRALYRSQRERELSAAPAFSRVWAGARDRARARAVRQRLPRWAIPTAAVLAAGLYAFIALRPPPQTDLGELVGLAQELAAWEAPLDFLLQTPGSELLETTPSFGRPLPGGALEINTEIQERTQS